MSGDPSSFTDWLREQMDARRWMPKDLASRTGVSLSHLVRVLNGERRPGEQFLRGVAAAFNMPQATVFRLAGVLTDHTGHSPEDARVIEIERLARRLSSDRIDILLAVARSLSAGTNDDQ